MKGNVHVRRAHLSPDSVWAWWERGDFDSDITTMEKKTGRGTSTTKTPQRGTGGQLGPISRHRGMAKREAIASTRRLGTPSMAALDYEPLAVSYSWF